MANYDILGNIAVVKFNHNVKATTKRKIAERILKENKSVRTILEKVGKFSGRLRTIKTKHLLGEKTKEALYKENSCVFRFNIDSCYFSSRLASERLEIAKKVKPGERVLVMFSGVAPFPIAISRFSKAREIVAVELGRECNKYAQENVKRSKISNIVLVSGDVKRKVPKLKGRFERIVMARPNLKQSFLDVAFKKIAKNGAIHYYGFYNEDKIKELSNLIEEEARKAKKKIKILKIKKAGDIAPYKFRWRVDFRVLK